MALTEVYMVLVFMAVKKVNGEKLNSSDKVISGIGEIVQKWQRAK